MHDRKIIISAALIMCIIFGCSGCSGQKNVTDTPEYIICKINGYPSLLKCNLNNNAIRPLCMDVYCSHTDNSCEFRTVADITCANAGSGLYYVKENPLINVHELRYYNYLSGEITKISDIHRSLCKLSYYNGKLYWWDSFYNNENDGKEEGRHLYLYDERTKKVTRLTDDLNYYGSENSLYLNQPQIIGVREDTAFWYDFPDFYKSGTDFTYYQKIDVNELPQSEVFTISGNDYIINGKRYTASPMYDGVDEIAGEYSLDEKDKIKAYSRKIVCEDLINGNKTTVVNDMYYWNFVIANNKIYYQPCFRPEKKATTQYGNDIYDFSHGNVYAYDIAAGETASVYKTNDRVLSTYMYTNGNTVMVFFYGYTQDGEYDVVPSAVFINDKEAATYEMLETEY